MIKSILITLLTMLAAHAHASDRVIVQSTTSTQNSGLYDVILPQFTEQTGIDVSVVAVGTGQALKNARNGDGDVVIVHARKLEDAFVAEGWGIDRRDLMSNDFVIVGPKSDPAAIAQAQSASAALLSISQSGAFFLSRGDDSGTHVKEVAIWASTGLDPTLMSGTWYRETGSGMGTTLNISVELDGYTITDRGTWISFGNKRDHVILFDGDPDLFNPYGVIRVNPQVHPHVNASGALALSDWLTSAAGRAAISNFELAGEQLFFPAVD